MIIHFSTQWMSKSTWYWRYFTATDVAEQNKRRSLCIRIRHLDILIMFVHRIGDFRKEYGL